MRLSSGCPAPAAVCSSGVRRHLPALIEHDVCGLDVAVDDAHLVQRLETSNESELWLVQSVHVGPGAGQSMLRRQQRRRPAAAAASTHSLQRRPCRLCWQAATPASRAHCQAWTALQHLPANPPQPAGLTTRHSKICFMAVGTARLSSTPRSAARHRSMSLRGARSDGNQTGWAAAVSERAAGAARAARMANAANRARAAGAAGRKGSRAAGRRQGGTRITHSKGSSAPALEVVGQRLVSLVLPHQPQPLGQPPHLPGRGRAVAGGSAGKGLHGMAAHPRCCARRRPSWSSPPPLARRQIKAQQAPCCGAPASPQARIPGKAPPPPQPPCWPAH